jgi:bifunctional non-homologous end joining protein LigD
MKKALRTGKVLVDWSQNDDHKTTVCVYSLRAKDRPTVSTPVEWADVEKTLKKKDPKLLVFEAGQAVERSQKFGDLYEPVLKLKQKLPSLAELQSWGGAAGPSKVVSIAGEKATKPSRGSAAKRRRKG